MNISANDPNAIAEILAQINGKATAHTASYSFVQQQIQTAERILGNLGIPVSKRKGAYLELITGSFIPRSYKYKVIVNTLILVRRAKEWRIISIKKIEIWPNQYNRKSFCLALTEAQDAIAVENVRSQYSILKGEK